MDSLTQRHLTRQLIDIDSTTGREAEAGAFVATTLEQLGWRVERQPVAGDRFNVWARDQAAAPEVVLSTHFDCVPPHIPSREADGRLYGRGACDAKGALVAQIAAAERMRATGEKRIGLLLVVGEERGSDGARAANAAAPGGVRYLVNGEPTDNRLGLATRGAYRVRLRARGRAAHSSRPELGVSAIDRLLDALLLLRDATWPADPDLGGTFYTIGLIAGGVAPNVVSPEATAELMFRTVGSHEEVRRAIAQRAGALVAAEDVLVVPPVRLTTIPGLPTEVFAFTTDIGFLDRWGAPLLIGPGSVTVAHTADEYCDFAALDRATDLYESVVRHLLAE